MQGFERPGTQRNTVYHEFYSLIGPVSLHEIELKENPLFHEYSLPEKKNSKRCMIIWN